MKQRYQSSPSVLLACDGDAPITARLLASGMDYYDRHMAREIPLPRVNWGEVLEDSRSHSSEELERRVQACDVFIFRTLPSKVDATLETWEATPHAALQQAIRRLRATGMPRIFVLWGPPLADSGTEHAVVRQLQTEEWIFRRRLEYLMKEGEEVVGSVEGERIARRLRRLANMAWKMGRQEGTVAGKWAQLERLVIRLTWLCERLSGVKWRIRAFGRFARIYLYLAYPFRVEHGLRYTYVAGTYYRRALVTSEALGDQEGIGMSCSGLGHVSQQTANLEEAEQWHQRALAVHSGLKRPELMADDYDALGYVYRCRKHGSKTSAEMFNKALVIWRTLGREDKIAWSASNAARAHYHAGEYGQARALLREALPVHEKLEDFSGIAWDCYYGGLVHWQHGDVEKAREFLRRSLERFEQCKNETLAKTVREYLEELSS